jgi:hypothetical protein
MHIDGETILMPKREVSKKIPGSQKSPGLLSFGFIKNAFRSLKFLFLFGCVVVLLAAIAIPQGPNKLVLVVTVPIIAELGVLGLGNYIVNSVYNISVFRGLLTVGFGVIIGVEMVLWGDMALTPGVIFIILSLGLSIWVLRKFIMTRDLGYRKQDPVLTLAYVLFMMSLTILVAGEFYLFISMFLASLLLMLYRGLFSTIFITLMTAGVMATAFHNIAYVSVILVVGIFAIILGFVARHRDAIRARMATAKQE